MFVQTIRRLWGWWWWPSALASERQVKSRGESYHVRLVSLLAS